GAAELSRFPPNTTHNPRTAARNPPPLHDAPATSLRTLPNPPSVATSAAKVLEPTAVILNATVDPNGGAVSDCHFEYGTSVFYEASVPCASLPGSGTAAVAMSAEAEGLSPNTTYHFRIVASNAGGTGSGADQTFTTASAAPSA